MHSLTNIPTVWLIFKKIKKHASRKRTHNYYETFLKGHYGIEIPNFHSLL